MNLATRNNVDFSIYARGFSLLARNPLIIAFLLLASIFGLGLHMLRWPLFNVMGFHGFAILRALAGLADGCAFALSIIAAETAWRGRKPTLSATWDEGKRKAGSILLAIIAFYFVFQVTALLGAHITPLARVFLPLVPLFFLIYTIPCAAIGGMPGAGSLGASIERVRENYAAAAVLTIVTALLYTYFLSSASAYFVNTFGDYAFYVFPVLKALVVAYLATVFARQYDEVVVFHHR